MVFHGPKPRPWTCFRYPYPRHVKYYHRSLPLFLGGTLQTASPTSDVLSYLTNQSSIPWASARGHTRSTREPHAWCRMFHHPETSPTDRNSCQSKSLLCMNVNHMVQSDIIGKTPKWSMHNVLRVYATDRATQPSQNCVVMPSVFSHEFMLAMSSTHVSATNTVLGHHSVMVPFLSCMFCDIRHELDHRNFSQTPPNLPATLRAQQLSRGLSANHAAHLVFASKNLHLIFCCIRTTAPSPLSTPPIPMYHSVKNKTSVLFRRQNLRS